ncbi:MAG TPA: biotin--[acetyl-CoA-carboxylase] ligase [Chloroflexi bacterium]|nr:biotin--[acetyl-CoA-carboxylase] ligase [Chloroflexota bacterium]
MTRGEPMEPLSKRRIWNALARLETGPFGANVHYYPRIGSTNDVARELAASHAPEGTLVIADEQTAGRGRMGRRWEAPPNTGLLMSLIFRPRLSPADVHRVVMVCGLAVAEACEASGAAPVAVKWPNDLQLGGKKFVGILPESAIMGDRLAWVIVGIGVNVNQVFTPPDPLYETATSLRMVTGSAHDRAALLARIMSRLNEWYGYLHDERLLEAWRERCTTLGQVIRARTAEGVVKGKAEEIDLSGALWIRDEAGKRHRLTASEVTLLRT